MKLATTARSLRTAGLTMGAAAGFLLRAHATTGTIQDVQHVVILMQENRSFDHYYGSLKGVRGFNDPNSLVFPNGNTAFYQPPGAGYVLPFHNAAQCLNDVDHSESSGDAAWDGGKWDQWIPAKGPATMAYHTRDDLPFYYALAGAFYYLAEIACTRKVWPKACAAKPHWKEEGATAEQLLSLKSLWHGQTHKIAWLPGYMVT
jgi:phospholipase C